MKWLVITLMVCLSVKADILPASRSVDWSQVGYEGGIPSWLASSTLSGIDNTGASDVSGAINSALSSCPYGTAVLLPAGKFLVTSTVNMASGAVLRGSGTNTILIGNINGPIVKWYQSFYYINQTNISSGYTKGSTNLVLIGLPSDLAVGTRIQITESNDTSFVNPSGIDGSVGEFAMGQYTEIQAINGNTLTVWPPLYMNYTNTCSPFIYWPVNAVSPQYNMLTQSGIENMVVSNINTGSSELNFQMDYCSRCWIKDVQSWWGSVCHVWLYNTFRCEIRDSSFNGVISPVTSSRCYGMQIGTPNSPHPSSKTSALLCENNVWTGCRGSVVVGYGASGCVFGYNYFVNTTNESAGYLRCDVFIHSAHPTMNLFEGNIGQCINADDFHGSSSHNVVFRNYWRGRDLTNSDTSSLRSIEMDAWQRYYSTFGNVAGYLNISNDMAALSSPTGGTLALALVPDTSWNYQNWYKALMFGYDGEGGGVTQNDTLVYSTAITTGNFDYVKNSVTWDTNGVQAIPVSLYQSGKPSWWDGSPWPPIGSDLSPMVGTIPAYDRYYGITHQATNSPTLSFRFNSIKPQ